LRFMNIINLDKDYQKKQVNNSHDYLLIDFLTNENKSNIFIDFNDISEPNSLNYTIFKIIIIHIILDSLNQNSLIELFKIVYIDKTIYDDKNKSFFINVIVKFFNDNMLQKNSTKVLILPFKNDSYDISLYKVKLDQEKQKLTLILGEYTDYNNFKDLLKEKYNLNYRDFANVVGFIYNTNESNYGIKLKSLKDKNVRDVYNDGTICNNLSKQVIRDRFIEEILENKMFTKLYNSKNYKTKSYCLIIEIFLRLFNIINYNDKIWFLNKNFTLFNKI